MKKKKKKSRAVAKKTTAHTLYFEPQSEICIALPATATHPDGRMEKGHAHMRMTGSQFVQCLAAGLQCCSQRKRKK